jgi:hypothetical protein
MLGIHTIDKRNELDAFLKLVAFNDVKIFQPPKSVGSGRARKQLGTYLKANKWLDNYIKQQNTIAVLMERRPVKPTYKKYEVPQQVYDGLFSYN